jgi:pantothenate kinase
VTQHASLSAERWARFGLDQQILMVANEMNRARGLFAAADREALRRTYERVLRLVDLTVETRPRRALRRELLRWRDLVAALYVAEGADAPAHDEAFRCLLRFTPTASKQIPHLLP